MRFHISWTISPWFSMLTKCVNSSECYLMLLVTIWHNHSFCGSLVLSKKNILNPETNPKIKSKKQLTLKKICNFSVPSRLVFVFFFSPPLPVIGVFKRRVRLQRCPSHRHRLPDHYCHTSASPKNSMGIGEKS